MNKSISIIIHEMECHRDNFLKKSTPYRQLNRAIKQLEKLERIEQIIKDYDGSQTSMITQFTKIQKLLEEETHE